MIRRNFITALVLMLIAPFLPESKRVKVPYAKKFVIGEIRIAKDTEWKYDEFILGDGSVVIISKDNNTIMITNTQGVSTTYTMHNKKWETHIGTYIDTDNFQKDLEYYEGVITDEELEAHKNIEGLTQMLSDNYIDLRTMFSEKEKALVIVHKNYKHYKVIS